MAELKNKRDILLVMAASFFFMACPMMVTPLITGFAGTLGASGTIMGLIGGLMNMCSMVCRPFAGNLADFNSKYRLSTIGALITAAACLMYVLADSTVVLVIARMINGIGFSLCSVCMTTWLASLLPRNRVGSGMGLYGTMNAIAMAVGPVVGIKIHDYLGYHVAFVAATALAVFMAVMVQFVGDKGKPKFTRAELKARGGGFKIIDKNVAPVAIIITLFTIPYCATQSFIVSYVKAGGLDVSASLFFPVYAVALVILRTGLGRAFDKYAYRYFFFASTASALLAMLSMTFMINNFIMVIAAVFMAGGYGIMCTVSQSTAILMAGKGREGLANSTYYFGFDLGMALGPIAGGILYEHLTIEDFYPALMGTAVLALIVYVVCRNTINMKIRDVV